MSREPNTPERPALPTTPPASEGAALFVWAVWGLMLLASFALAWKYTPQLPRADDWHGTIPVLTGDHPFSLAWLWEVHGDHRIPLAKLLEITLLRVTHGEFRTRTLFNVLSLGALAFAMIRAARKVRGYTSYSDAFFPVLFLHWGQDVFVDGWMTYEILSAVLVGLVFLIIVRAGTKPSLGKVLLLGSIILLLPLCGPTGMAYVPALAAWLAYAGVRLPASQDPGGRWVKPLLLAFAVLALVLVGVYHIGYEQMESRSTLRSTLSTSLQVLSTSVGVASNPYWKVFGLAVLGLVLVTAILILAAWRRRPGEAVRAAGLLAFLGGLGCLVLGVGWARAAIWGGLESRYVVLALPALYCAYYAWELYGTPTAARFVQMGMLSLVGILLFPNLQHGLRLARSYRDLEQAFERDLRAGVPPFMLVKLHNLGPESQDEEKVAASMRSLKRAGLGQFRLMQDDPAYREVRLPVVPSATADAKWTDGVAHGSGNNASIRFKLTEPRFVYGIRLRYSFRNEDADPMTFQVEWKGHDSKEFIKANVRHQWYWNIAWFREREPELEVTVWINHTLDEFRILPDTKPYVLQVSEIALLVPADQD